MARIHGAGNHARDVRKTTMEIDVKKIDLLAFDGDAIIVPTTSSGRMDTPIAARVRARVGETVETEVASHAPIAVGACLVTAADPLGVRFLIHAPVVEEAGMRIGVENIRRAVHASLLGAVRHEMETLGVPGFGYEDSGVSHEETARAIIDELTGFKGAFPLTVVLLDTNDQMFEAFSEATSH